MKLVILFVLTSFSTLSFASLVCERDFRGKKSFKLLIERFPRVGEVYNFTFKLLSEEGSHLETVSTDVNIRDLRNVFGGALALELTNFSNPLFSSDELKLEFSPFNSFYKRNQVEIDGVTYHGSCFWK